MRRVEVACLSPSGDVNISPRLVPALPAFEEPFAAFTRATLVATDRGLTAVGDLWPGDQVRTVGSGFQTLLWKGTTLLVPQAAGQDPAMGTLTRIAADALGIARPMHDLVLGPSARVTQRGAAVERLTGREAALIPARDFIDGCGVIEITPPAPVEICHLGFAGHEIIVANGVEVESYHPEPVHNLGLHAGYIDLFLSCFPHVDDMADWGLPAFPRLRRADLDLTCAA
ncbi:MAG: Hint domain-containing protein [Rubellimicrobium sp.]|nr:Hint domain-containing protein [Rubellimicrobium sp.]